MKKMLKRAVTAVLILTLVLSASIQSFAADPIRLTLGGKTLDVSPVLVQDGVTYAPYDALFAALGARAAYDEAERTITAVSGDTEVVIPMDSTYAWVTVGDSVYDLYNRSLPIETAGGGVIYVPVRTAAQALGYAVSWDGGGRTVALKTLDALIAESGAAYTVLDTVLKYSRSFSEKSHAMSGSFDLTLDTGALLGALLGGGEEEAPPPLTIGGTASGLFDKGGEELSLKLKTNLADYAGPMSGEEPLDDETQALLEQLGEFDLDLIINGDAGLTYLKSPLLSALAGVPDDTWISFETEDAGLTTDLSDILGGYGYAQAGSLGTSIHMPDKGGFREYVKEFLRLQLLYGDTDIAETLAGINKLYSDQAMTRSGDTYTVTMATEPSEDDWYAVSETMTMTFTLGGGAFKSASVTYSSESSYEDYFSESSSVTKTELSFSYSAAGQGSLKYTTAVDGVTALGLTMDFSFSQTTLTPAREPAAGSAVISSDDIPGTVTPDAEDTVA